MREYKPIYCLSLLYGFVIILLTAIPMLAIADVDMYLDGKSELGQFFAGILLTGIYLFLILTVIVLLINLVVLIFTQKSVTLSDSVILWDGKQILLNQIREITVFLPEISKTRSRPHSVTVWASKTDYFDIKRPSLGLLIALKKRCPQAKFHIDDWRQQIKEILLLQGITTAIAIIATLFGWE